MRHTGTVIHFIGRIRLSAHRAIAAQYAAVKLQHLFAACRLMQPIYILSDDRAQLSLLLKLGKLEMRGIGLYVIDNELFPVKSVILLGITGKERVAEYRFGRILPFWLYRPSTLRKSGIPLSVDTPAPPKNTTLSLSSIHFLAALFYHP